MEYPYRFVVNPLRASLHVIELQQGLVAHSKNVSSEFLAALAAGKSLTSTDLARLKEARRWKREHWLVEDGKGQWVVNGSLRWVNSEDHLTKVQIEITRHCNLHCGYCYSESGPRQRTRWTKETLIELLHQIEAEGAVWVDITGGEPLMFPGCLELLEEAKALGLILTVHSNGCLVTEDVAAKFRDLAVNMVQISFDSNRPAVHDSLRNRGGAFEKAVKGLLRLKAAGVPARVSLMVHRHNVGHIQEAMDWFGGLGVPVGLDRVVAVGGELEAGAGLTAKEFYEAIATKLPNRTVVTNKLCETKPQRDYEPHCGVGHSYMYITAEGECAMCPTMTSREAHRFTGPQIINADGQSLLCLREIWRESQLFVQNRLMNCNNVGTCPASDDCRGGCRSNAYIEAGDPEAPDIVSCNLFKNETQAFVDFQERYARGQYQPISLSDEPHLVLGE